MTLTASAIEHHQKAAKIYSTNYLKSKFPQLVIYGLGGEHTHIHIYTHILYWHEGDFKKPGTPAWGQCGAGLKIY